MTVKTVGLDLAKDVFQVHCVSATGRRIINKKIKRAKLLAFFETLPRCLVGMEACWSAHHWGRELRKLGHDVRLMPAAYVKAYVKRGKTDAADAEAICEAVRRPTMRFVEIKSEDQQAVLAIHRARDLVVRQRTQVVNMIRSILREFGHILPTGIEAVVRRQSFWHQWLPKLRESFAHLVGLIMRRAGGDASVALRASFV